MPQRLDFWLKPATELTGSVRFRDGKPVKGAAVSFSGREAYYLRRKAVGGGLSTWPRIAPSVLTDDDGCFRSGEIPNGETFCVIATGTGVIPAVSDTLVLSGASVTHVDLEVSEGAELSGVVRDEDGVALPGVGLWFQVWEGEELRVERGFVKSSDTGTYRVSCLPAGASDYRLEGASEDVDHRSRFILHGPWDRGENVSDIVLHACPHTELAPERIRVIVVPDDSEMTRRTYGMPYKKRHLSYLRCFFWESGQPRPPLLGRGEAGCVEEQGFFFIPAYRDRCYDIVLSNSRGWEKERRTVRVEDSPVVFVWEAQAEEGLAEIAGTVIDAQESVVPNVKVSLLEPGGTTLRSRRIDETVTDSDGRFSFPRLQAGTYVINSVSEANGRARDMSVLVEEGERTELEIRIEKCGKIAGRVVGEYDRRRADLNVDIVCMDEGMRIKGSAALAEDGTFASPDLPTGRYRLTFHPDMASRPGEEGEPATRPIALAIGVCDVVVAPDQTVNCELPVREIQCYPVRLKLSRRLVPVEASRWYGRISETRGGLSSYINSPMAVELFLPMGVYKVDLLQYCGPAGGIPRPRDSRDIEDREVALRPFEAREVLSTQVTVPVPLGRPVALGE